LRDVGEVDDLVGGAELRDRLRHRAGSGRVADPRRGPGLGDRGGPAAGGLQVRHPAVDQPRTGRAVDGWKSVVPRPAVEDELAVSRDHFAVDGDRAARPQVADHVPVQAGLVVVAGLGVALADGGVERAADLLVEQRVPGVLSSSNALAGC